MVWSLCLHGNAEINSVNKVIFHFNRWLHNYIWGAAHLLVDSSSFGVEYCPTSRFPYSFHLTKHPCNVLVWDLLLVVTLHTRGSKVKTDSWYSSAEPQYCSCNFKLPLWRMAPKCVKSTQWQPSESKKEFTSVTGRCGDRSSICICINLLQLEALFLKTPFKFNHLFFQHVKTHLN